MMYFALIFASPVYFATRKRWGALMLNAILYGLAWLSLLSILGAFLAPIFWILAVGHAGWYFRREMMEQHAEMLATKMAEKMRSTD